MEHAPARTAETTSGSMARMSVGGLFIEALARQDFAALAGCLDPGIRLRALLPRGPVEMAGRDEVAGWFRFLFGGPDDLELADGTVGAVGPRVYMRWRAGLTPAGAAGPSRLVEQHAFVTGGERITTMDLLCSGFVTQPNPATNP
ncbi:MAG TPA: nuclear transport factor 2 family protein [Streptosporangiaceae bacterium]|jgi:hypothetical protein|nr:nuclear transport factor 2 family protein [Streptosporangiaceae bacterium]